MNNLNTMNAGSGLPVSTGNPNGNQPGNRELSQTVSADTKHYIERSLSEATRRAYRADVKIFNHWCEANQLQAMPATPETIADFLTDQAKGGTSHPTLTRRVAAIKYAHELAELESPTDKKLVSVTMKGIRREHGKPPAKKAAATIDKLYQLLAMVDTSTLQGKRDKALLVLGFAGAFRRSELSAVTVADVTFVEQGLKVFVPESKTDQTREGETVFIISQHLDVAGLLREYLDVGQITEGAIFRPITKGGNLLPQALSAFSIAGIVKRYAAAAGFDPEQFGGHSLRAGFVTTALGNGAGMFRVMDVTRHKSVQTLKGYDREANGFKNHAGNGFL